jgi:hypothetical protein
VKIRFKTSVATARGSFLEGRVIEVNRLSSEQQQWLEAGAIEILTDPIERAVPNAWPEHAVPAINRRARKQSTKKSLKE